MTTRAVTAHAVTDADGVSIHATAVLVGDRAVLIRGPSGAGKSRLAFDLILAGRTGQIATATLVGDDRVFLEASEGQLVVRPVPPLAGLIEIYGLGIRRCAFAEQAILGMVVDLAAADAERLPSPESLRTEISGVEIPRIPVKASSAPANGCSCAYDNFSYGNLRDLDRLREGNW